LHVQFLKLYGDINLIIWVDTVTRDADCQPRIWLFPDLGVQIIKRSTDIIFGIVQTFHQIIYRRIYIERWSSHFEPRYIGVSIAEKASTARITRAF